MSSHVALLRAIAHVPMHPFREVLEEMGFSEVSSYGMSGNLLFTPKKRSADSAKLERDLSKRLSALTIVRTREEIEEAVASDPFEGRAGAAVMFLLAAPGAEALAELEAVEFEGERPRISGKTIHFIYPARPRGRKTGIDFERILKVSGTARTSSVVSRILERISDK